jgi:hypothetical protein
MTQAETVPSVVDPSGNLRVEQPHRAAERDSALADVSSRDQLTHFKNPFLNIVLLLVTGPIAIWISWRNRNYQLDDALIYLRYVRNFFKNNGLAYNVGDYFNGLTSPLYSYLLIAANVAIRNLQFTTIFLSFVFLWLAALFGAAIVSKNRYEQVLCGFFVVSFNYFYTTFGMETTLFLFLTAFALFLYKNDHFFFAGIVISLVILTRTEGIFFGGGVFLHYILTNKRLPPIKYLTVPVIIILINLIFNQFYYGAPLPATGNAKIGQGHSGFWGTGLLFLDVSYMKTSYFGGSYHILWFMLATSMVGLWSSWRSLTTRLILIYLVLLGVFYVFLRIPNYHWYYGPFFYFLTLFSASGAYQLVQRAIHAHSRADSLLTAAPIVALIVIFSIHNLQLSNVSRSSFTPYQNIGEWINTNTAPNATIAAVEIGTIGWYSDRYIIDILGLTNPYNADFIAQKDVYSWLTKYSPDYIVVHDPLWALENSANCLMDAGAYAPTPGFHFAGYQLLAKKSVSNIDALIHKCGRIAESFEIALDRSGRQQALPLRNNAAAVKVSLSLPKQTGGKAVGQILIMLGNFNNTADGKLRVQVCNAVNACAEGERPLSQSIDNRFFPIMLDRPLPITNGLTEGKPPMLTVQIQQVAATHPVAIWMWSLIQKSAVSQGITVEGPSAEFSGMGPDLKVLYE